MTKQAIFDWILVFMRKQRNRAASVEDPAMCMYKDAAGNKCAIGCLPTFPSRMENERMTFTDLLRSLRFDELLDLLPDDCTLKEGTAFLGVVQLRLHDLVGRGQIPFLEDLERSAEEVAEQWNLTYTPPSTQEGLN